MIQTGRMAFVTLALLAVAWMLVGCVPDKPDPNAPALNIYLGMVDSSGRESNIVRAGAPLTVTASVFDRDGNPVKGAVVEFSATVAKVDPPSALTDSSGKARVQLLYQEGEAGDVGAGGQPELPPQALLGRGTAKALGGDRLIATVTDAAGNTYQAEKGYEVRAPDYSMGSPGADGVFREGVLELSKDSLQAGESMTVTAYLVHSKDRTPVNAPLFVNFSSACADLEPPQATIDPVVQLDGFGRATAKYTAGCTGTDTIIASLNFGGGTFTATGNVSVQSSTVERIEFLGIDDGDGNGFELAPGFMAIRGLGHRANAPEFVKAKFRVTDVFGNPAPNRRVEFDLTTAVGGIQVTPAQDFTNANGEVEVLVRSGAVSAETRVVASTINAEGQARSALSDTIFISLFVADADSFSLSQDGFNVEAGDFDGTEVKFTIRAADMNNHAVRPGTVIAFRASHGRIQPSCVTIADDPGTLLDESGTCEVTWVSQDPRPASGLVAILAYVEGVETFSDENGNGVFDRGEPYWNLPEAFVDANFNGARDPGEAFIDYNVDGRWNDGMGDGGTEFEYPKYNGLLVSDKAYGILGTPGTDGRASETMPMINVFERGLVMMSSSDARINADGVDQVGRSFTGDALDPPTNRFVTLLVDNSTGPGTLNVSTPSTLAGATPTGPGECGEDTIYADTAQVPTPDDCAGTVTVRVTDTHNPPLPMPAGTTISATVESGGFSLGGSTSVTVPSVPAGDAAQAYAAAVTELSFTVTDSVAGEDGSGRIRITVTTPKGIVTEAFIDVNS